MQTAESQTLWASLLPIVQEGKQIRQAAEGGSKPVHLPVKRQRGKERD